jgi:hypothetical protein
MCNFQEHNVEPSSVVEIVDDTKATKNQFGDDSKPTKTKFGGDANVTKISPKGV